MIRVLVADDQNVVRSGLRMILAAQEDIEVIGEAGSVAEAVTEAARVGPDVVLMDLRLPDGSGIDACREMLTANPAIRVLFLTSYPDREAVISTILAGAAGYLLKEIGQQTLIDAVIAVASGQSILDTNVTKTVLEQVQAVAEQSDRQHGDRKDDLSPQERRILALVVEGKTNKEIAAVMDLSDKTVRNYLSNVFQKLNVSRRAEAAAHFSRLLHKAGRR